MNRHHQAQLNFEAFSNLPQAVEPPRAIQPEQGPPAMEFYLGIHQPHWLAQMNVPAFVSRARLAGRKTFPRATGAWALDSGGFSQLSNHGRWTFGAEQYVEEVRRFAGEIGGMRWAAIQDHMCEPDILRKTASTVTEHQQRTVRSYLTLRDLAPELPWLPVLQGWCHGEPRITTGTPGPARRSVWRRQRVAADGTKKGAFGPAHNDQAVVEG